ncbi:MAG: phage holin family protein [Erysipelotrichia bacterium]|nr:phage holin family protein [Erysipelotrichia bacterium]
MNDTGKGFFQIWLVDGLSLWAVDKLFGSSIQFADAWALIFTALALAVLTVTIKPVLKLISLPVTILTFGLFSIIINALVLQMAFALNSGSYIASFGTAVWASIILAIVNSIFSSLLFK